MVVKTYRGWQGHFICQCHFHLNTLLDLDGFKIVVSTVGNYRNWRDDKVESIGHNRYWETMAFESSYDKFDDANVSKQVNFDSEWAWASPEDELLAQVGHFTAVAEIEAKMLSGEITKDSWVEDNGYFSFQQPASQP